MHEWILYFQLLTASSVKIFVKDIVRPSRKNLWHASLLVSIPEKKKTNARINFRILTIFKISCNLDKNHTIIRKNFTVY